MSTTGPNSWRKVSASVLEAAQRARVDELHKAARAGEDRELLRVVKMVLKEGPRVFDSLIGYAGGRASEGLTRDGARIHVPRASRYVALRSDASSRWRAGEVGVALPNDFSEKYDLKLDFGAVPKTDEERRHPLFGGAGSFNRVFYMMAEEVAPVTAWMELEQTPMCDYCKKPIVDAPTTFHTPGKADVHYHTHHAKHGLKKIEAASRSGHGGDGPEQIHDELRRSGYSVENVKVLDAQAKKAAKRMFQPWNAEPPPDSYFITDARDANAIARALGRESQEDFNPDRPISVREAGALEALAKHYLARMY